MKFTKLSLIATLAISSAFAGGDIAPVEPVVEAPVVEAAACNSNTTINTKAVLYSYTNDNAGANSLYDSETSALGAALTLDVSHKIMDGITANATAVGFANLLDEGIDAGIGQYFEGQETGAFINVANITATFGDTTLVAGRQLLNTPMLSGFDWLLAPGAFEAYTLVNTSIPNVTIVGSYIDEYRPNNFGTAFDFLKADGDNWTVGASYSDAFDASVWYYNVDHADYTQVYADAGTSISGFDIAAQYVATDAGALFEDSDTYGIKVGTKVADFDLAAAYVNTDGTAINQNLTVDGLYTTMWNSFAAGDEGDSWMVSAATEFSGISASVAYADYEEIGNEFDLILGYGVTDCISLDAIFTSTAYDEDMDEDNALELIATYKF